MEHILALCALTLVLVCSLERKKDVVTLSGTIENPNGETLKIYNGRDVIKEIVVNEDGTLSDTLQVESGYYTFNHGGERSTMYLEPGYTMQLTLNTEEFDETIAYKGKGAENNNYLASKYLNEEQNRINYEAVYSLDEKTFIAKMDSIKISKDNYLNTAENLSAEFKEIEGKSNYFNHLIMLLNYPSYHEFYTQKEDFKPSENFMQAFKNIDLNDEVSYNMLGSYKNFVLGYYSNKIEYANDPIKVFKDITKDASVTVKNDLAENLNIVLLLILKIMKCTLMVLWSCHQMINLKQRSKRSTTK